MKEWRLAIIWASLIFLGSCLPGASVSEVDSLDFLAHKLIHIFEYAVLAGLLLRAFQLRYHRSICGTGGGKKLLTIMAAVLAICFLYGLSDELHQSFVSGREAKLRDAFIDLLGGGFGILLLWTLPRKTPLGSTWQATKNTKETFKLGEDLSKDVKPGVPVFFYGSLGAGKTELIKGICAGLGFGGRVLSPTFQLVREYKCANLKIYHIDLYRLGGEGEIGSLDLKDYLADNTAVVLLEWADRLEQKNLPKPRVEIKIEFLSENERKFVILEV